jgi:3-hydroxyacyl-[acyl-carrier-protein] dehydratase
MPQPLIDPSTIDFDHAEIDRAVIRELIPQRFEMEQITAVVKLDPEAGLIVGYRDVGHDEFWIRGHLPQKPLFPGVLMLEAAGQISSIYYHLVLKDPRHPFIGYAGLDDVRFRGTVAPGDRLVLVARNKRLQRRMAVFETQGLVGSQVVFEAVVLGAPVKIDF